MTHTLTGLYGITDAELMPNTETLLHKVEKSLKGGSRIIQYRDKHSSTEIRLQQAKALNALCQSFNVPLLINDDVELAVACGAAGVHLGQRDGSVTHARKQLGEKAVIGVTCHDSLQLAKNAQAQGASYVAFGAFFPSKTKPDAKPAPISLLQQVKAEVDLPIVAIGGISMDNAQQIISAGADMIAVIHALYAQDDIQATAAQFHQLFTESER